MVSGFKSSDWLVRGPFPEMRNFRRDLRKENESSPLEGYISPQGTVKTQH